MIMKYILNHTKKITFHNFQKGYHNTKIINILKDLGYLTLEKEDRIDFKLKLKYNLNNREIPEFKTKVLYKGKLYFVKDKEKAFMVIEFNTLTSFIVKCLLFNIILWVFYLRLNKEVFSLEYLLYMFLICLGVHVFYQLKIFFFCKNLRIRFNKQVPSEYRI